MSIETIASRYAKSLIDIGLQNNTLDTCKADMDTCKIALANHDFMMMTKSPIISSTQKQNAMKAVFGDGIHSSTYNFLNLIIQKGREQYLSQIVESFTSQYNQLLKITSATLITAQAVDSSFVDQIKSKFPNPATVQIKNVIDPSILGGFVLKFGDTLYDASVAKQLTRLKTSLI